MADHELVVAHFYNGGAVFTVYLKPALHGPISSFHASGPW